MNPHKVLTVLGVAGMAYMAIAMSDSPTPALATLAAASVPPAIGGAAQAAGDTPPAANGTPAAASVAPLASVGVTLAAAAGITPAAAGTVSADNVDAPADRPPATPAASRPADAAAPGPAQGLAPVRVLVAAEQEATLYSQGIGRIRDVDASLGSRFKAGATLVSFDCDEQLARLKMAQAELSAAREQHNAKLRLQGLQSAGELEVSLAAAAAQKAEAQVNLYRAQQAYCIVKAPFDGRVVKLHVKDYEGVNQNAPLLDIISDGPLKLRLNVPSAWMRWLKPNTPFQVHIDETDGTYKARVTAINGRVDAVSQSVELEAVIADGAKDLLPGMSGSALFTPAS